MISSVDNYALKDTIIEAIQWTGNDMSFRLINEFTRGNVELNEGLASGVLTLRHNGEVSVVLTGDYVVKIAPGNYERFTEDELRELYTKVGD